MSFPSQNTPKTALPQTPSWFQGGRFAAEEEWREGSEGLGRGKIGKGEREEWEWGREMKGESWWRNSALVVGDNHF